MATAPAGFAPVFVGWNVWDVWQSDDPPFSVMNIGLDLERQLRIYIENKLADEAPGVAVADPLNPAALRGDQIQIIPRVEGLEFARTRADVPELAGSMNLGGGEDSKAILRTVRFFNRGSEGALPWPHDPGYLLENVYTPDPHNAVTGAPQPGSLGGAASEGAAAVGKVVTAIAWVGGGVAAVVLVAKLLELAAARARAHA
jgi:hypothetical protein